MDVYRELVRERDAGRPAALATIVNVTGSTPSRASAKMLVREDGSIVGTVGGGAAEAHVIAVAREVMESGVSQTLTLDLREKPEMDMGMICGGRLQVYVEFIRPARTIFIFGGGHIGLVTARLCRMIGLEVEIIDDRPEFASPDRFPDAGVHVGTVEAVAATLRPNARSLVFIATRGHAFDQDALAWALGTPAGYIGMIGSKRKVLTIYENLRKAGFAAEAFARVHAPVGLDIGAESPEEIAVSVLAEIIAELHDAPTVQPLKRTMDQCEPILRCKSARPADAGPSPEPLPSAPNAKVVA